MGIRRYLLCLPLLLCFQAHGQAVKASLNFVGDTTSVGMPIMLRVAISHPENVPIIFPWKKRYFRPFEYIRHEAVPTRTEDGISYDTALYLIRTFNMEDVQSLKLPFKYVDGEDTLTIFTETDSIQLNYRYQEGTPIQDFRSIEVPIEMTDPPNYPLIGLLGIAGIVFLIGLFYVLREPVTKRLRLRRNRKQFEEALFKLRSITALKDISIQLENLNSLWKGYLDPEEEFKLNALTTSELKDELTKFPHLNEDQQEKLVDASQLYDRAIYASDNVGMDEVNDLLVQLLPVFEAEYLRRKNIIAQEK